MRFYEESRVKRAAVPLGRVLTVASDRKDLVMGLDLGQKRDHTAMAVIERGEVTYRERNPVTFAPYEKTEYRLRYLGRLPLGLTYPEVAARVDSLVTWLRTSCRATGITLVVDATGVGQPVVDLLRAEQLGCNIVPVTITGGDRASQTRDGWVVPKRDLITGLQLLYEQDDLKMARGLTGSDELMAELSEMRVRFGDRGQERFAVWRNGMHDDLVLAVALAAWRAKSAKSPWGKTRLV